MTVGDRIKELRLKLGLSQVDFADKINVSKQTLYKYENNIITNIPSDKVEAAAKLGNISPSYLMGWEGVNWDLLQKQKESRKQFAYAHNIQYFEKRMLDSFSKLNDANKKKEVLLILKNFFLFRKWMTLLHWMPPMTEVLRQSKRKMQMILCMMIANGSDLSDI